MNHTTPPALSSLPVPTQRAVTRALILLEKQLREPGAVFTSTHAVRDWLRLHLACAEREVFQILLLDNQHRLLAYETLFTGTLNSTEVHPREVVKLALSHNAAAIIVAHCHPSGLTEPSQADKAITQRLQQALALVDIPLLDHFIVGQLTILSFAERGLL
ncbi:DNA repair protein RadC [Edwardsiella tarda]|uniref:RadC family protein n=1 Tax=Edwardsiella tarda TaxID=636 RepID=UPI000D51A0C7|nr:DNA repair protein RadC [Edwardsiella tarda]UCQ26619.1 DNA repair protein RadC [Edwardsiella tarda]